MNRDLIFLMLSLLLWGIGEGSFYSFIPLYLQELGAKAIQIGSILGGLSFAAMLCHLPAGYLADKFGRRTIIIASWLIGLLATLFMFLSKSLSIFIPSLLLYGATAFVLAPMNSYIADLAPRGSLNRVLTLISASYNFGYIFGPLMGGILAEKYGLRQLFLFAFCLFLISTMLIFLLRPQPITPSPRGMAFFRSIFNPKYSFFVSVIALTIFATYLPQPLSPNYLQNQHLLSLSTIGFLFFVNGGGIVAFNLLLGAFSPIWGILLGQVLVILFSILLLHTASLPFFAIAFFILGSFRAARTVSVAQLRNYLNPESMGLGYGFAESVFALAMILADLFAGFLYEHKPTAMYVVSILLTLFAIGLTLVFSFFSRAQTTSMNQPQTLEEPNNLPTSEGEQVI